MTKFEELKKDVKDLLMSELSNSINSIGTIDSELSAGKKISAYGDRLSNLDETTVKYLMRLTNDYIRAKRENSEVDLQTDLTIFKKYGFDARDLDEKIQKIEYPYNADNEMWPNKTQEDILQTVFSYFECPGKLPSVDTILEIASKFGATYGDTEHTHGVGIAWIDTRHFDDPYDICKHFSTALNNGLSVEQIIQLTKEINTYMDYYNAPNGLRTFSKGEFRSRMTGIVPFLEKDHKRASDLRAIHIYQVINRGLALQGYNSSLNNTDEIAVPKMHR